MRAFFLTLWKSSILTKKKSQVFRGTTDKYFIWNATHKGKEAVMKKIKCQPSSPATQKDKIRAPSMTKIGDFYAKDLQLLVEDLFETCSDVIQQDGKWNQYTGIDLFFDGFSNFLPPKYEKLGDSVSLYLESNPMSSDSSGDAYSRAFSLPGKPGSATLMKSIATQVQRMAQHIVDGYKELKGKEAVMKKSKCQLIGRDGNVFGVMGRVIRALKQAGVSKNEIDKYRDDATSGDYNNALAESVRHLDLHSIDWE